MLIIQPHWSCEFLFGGDFLWSRSWILSFRQSYAIYARHYESCVCRDSSAEPHLFKEVARWSCHHFSHLLLWRLVKHNSWRAELWFQPLGPYFHQHPAWLCRLRNFDQHYWSEQNTGSDSEGISAPTGFLASSKVGSELNGEISQL